MCGDWCYTVRRATPCGLRDGLAAQGRGDRVARFEFSGSLSDEIAGKTRVSCLLPTPPQPSAGGRIGRRGKVGRKTIKKLSDKSQTASFVRRLFGIVAEQAILGGWATSSDSFVRGRAAGMRVPPPSPATPVRLPFRSRRPVWLGRRPAGRRPHRAGAASDRPCRSGPRSRTSA